VAVTKEDRDKLRALAEAAAEPTPPTLTPADGALLRAARQLPLAALLNALDAAEAALVSAGRTEAENRADHERVVRELRAKWRADTERASAAEAKLAALLALLREHADAFAPDHHADDCPDDGECERCVLAAEVEALCKEEP